MSLEGMGPTLAVEGSTTAGVFEAYLERVLLPELDEGQVLVMDNLPAHKPDRVRELIEGRGWELLYLPGYSPEYNPIEEAFSKIEEMLRRAAARTREALVEALGLALSAVSRADARAFFRACRLPSDRPTTMKRAVGHGDTSSYSLARTNRAQADTAKLLEEEHGCKPFVSKP
jgi:transposase